MLNKRIILLLLILVIISVSGCVISEKNTTGWDWKKYEKYSEFYDKINDSKPASTDSVEDFMVGMSQDTGFDKTWYLTFLYMKRGIEAREEGGKEVRRLPRWKYAEVDKSEYVGGGYAYTKEYWTYITDYNTRKKQIENRYTSQSENYYNQSYEYRQKIEEMKPPK